MRREGIECRWTVDGPCFIIEVFTLAQSTPSIIIMTQFNEQKY